MSLSYYYLPYIKYKNKKFIDKVIKEEIKGGLTGIQKLDISLGEDDILNRPRQLFKTVGTPHDLYGNIYFSENCQKNNPFIYKH